MKMDDRKIETLTKIKWAISIVVLIFGIFLAILMSQNIIFGSYSHEFLMYVIVSGLIISWGGFFSIIKIQSMISDEILKGYRKAMEKYWKKIQDEDAEEIISDPMNDEKLLEGEEND